MTAGNDKKDLRPGEKFVVTVQEVLHNTLIVYLEYRKVKFSGALLNTTNRRAPYGIKENPAESYYQAYGIDPKAITTKEKGELEKARVISNPPLPPPIDTRTTYAQKLHLPPPRQIHQRRRRSKRKVRMDMMDTDLAFKLMSNGSNQKLHSDTCCCDRCAIQSTSDMSEEKSLKGKRKLLGLSPKMNLKRRSSGSYDDMTAIPAKSKQTKLELGNSAQARLKKPLLESRDPASTSIKRSPVIKISYKAPGGKGQVLEIPSKVHTPALCMRETKMNALQERARKVVIRAKSEHIKFMQDQKPEDPKHKKQAISQANSKNLKFADTKVIATANVSLRGKESTNTSASSVAIECETNQDKSPSVKKTLSKLTMEQEKSPIISSKDPAFSSKRLLRSVTPQVLISPLSEVSGEEDIPSSPTAHHDGMATSGEKLHSSSPKKKDPSKLSHTITVTRCVTRDGVRWCQGDVVWGKIHGFPWWPGLLKRIVVKKAQNSLEQIAIVDWFQSKTISHIPCSQLESFSGNFKKRYSKKLKGNYKKAIQEAHEAEKNMSPEVRKLIMQFET